MMRTGRQVAVAVRSEETGGILTDGFEAPAPKGRWARWPLLRGVFAIRTALSTGQKAMTLGEQLRWGEGDQEAEPLGFWAKVLVGVAAVLGVAVQIAAYRIAPIVIAKEAGLEGAAFILADAAIRLMLLLGTLLVMSRFRPFRKILSYHGAEHKAIAAHEAGSPLTAAAAAGFSRFHPRCGTSFLVVSAIVSIAVYGAVLAITGVFSYLALIATRIIGAPIVTAIAFELQRKAAKHADGRLRFLSFPGMAAQRLTTAPPGPEELEVACAALQCALDRERDEVEHPAAVQAPASLNPAPATQ